MSANHLMHNYARQEIGFDHGAGAWLYDTDGKKYLDAVGGLAVNVLGHAHPAVTAAVSAQAGALLHTSNLYRIPLQEQLADRLTALCDMDSAFFCNSGAEANEAAIKLARLHGHRREIGAPHIVVMEHAFHGRTMATLTATGNRRAQAGFEPLLAGFVRSPWDDIEALQTIAAQRSDVVAVMLEPIQGEGGIRQMQPGRLAGIRALCDAQGWLLICDEIQSGMGRTGRFLASMHENVRPDIVTLAKGLANGVPIGACLARGEAASLFAPGNHGSTFGGNPLACRAALAVLDVLEQEGLIEQAAATGDWLIGELRQRTAQFNCVREVRGRGLMIGVELDRDAPELVAAARASGLLINVTAGRVIRLLPPLILTRDEATQIADLLTPLIAALETAPEAS